MLQFGDDILAGVVLVKFSVNYLAPLFFQEMLILVRLLLVWEGPHIILAKGYLMVKNVWQRLKWLQFLSIQIQRNHKN